MIDVRLTLVSASPRRAELLRGLKLPFDVLPSTAAEYWTAESPVRLAMDNARRKVERSPLFGDRSRVLLGADTIISCDSHVFGKPIGAESAKRMLRILSNRVHHVVTGICLSGPSPTEHSLVVEAGATSHVRFRDLLDSEIRAYIQTNEWRGKAGAYAIQGHAGKFVAELEGDYDNVVGLPLNLLDDLLRQSFVHCRFC